MLSWSHLHTKQESRGNFPLSEFTAGVTVMNDFKLCHKVADRPISTQELRICIKYIYVEMLEDDSRGEEIKFTTTKQNVRQPLLP